MDDTPPFPINQEALDIAIEISLLMNCSIVDEVHVTRKQYLDGSIPTGFQRTLVVGVEGWIPFRGRRLAITQVNLEEDACREISDIGHDIIFRTDRLSTPLVEVITEKELFTPREMMEANRELGRVLRASGKVRRGIGSVRQDVNVSVRGGDRNEIKGVQRYQRVLALTHYEGLRQKALLDLRDLLNERGITDKTMRSEDRIFKEGLKDLRTPFLNSFFRAGQVIGVVKLCGFSGILGKDLTPGRPFAEEFADRVRVIACLDGKPNLVHSDLKEESGVFPTDWEILSGEMGARQEDVLAVTFGSEEDVRTAISEIKIRAREAALGVPRETRQDLGGGITGFERILPGPDRMYPDTDSEPVRVTEERVERIRKQMPARPWEKEERCRALGVPDALTSQLADSEDYQRFERLGSRHGKLAASLAGLMCHYFPWLEREGRNPQELTDETLTALASAIHERTIGQENLPQLLFKLSGAEPGAQENVLKAVLRVDAAERVRIEKRVREAIRESVESFRGDPAHLFDAAMGYLVRKNKDLAVSSAIVELVRGELRAAELQKP
jgi:glutamyl-tRNA(Gln) amidotransferase subunit E